MAVVQYSALVTQLRGKLGGSQFNRGSGYYSLQRKSTPTRRDSPAQQFIRSLNARILAEWRNETPSRRAQASQAGISNPVSDRFGQQKTLTAYLQYKRIMFYRGFVTPGTATRPFAGDIITTPVNSAVLEVDLTSLVVSASPVPGYVIASYDLVRTTNGTQSGPALDTRAFIYIVPASADGVPLTGYRFSLLRVLTYVDTPISASDLRVRTSVPLWLFSHFFIRVETVNTGAGAITGVYEYGFSI